MTVEALLEELRHLPATAYVVVTASSWREGVSIDRATYDGGEVVIYLDTEDEDGMAGVAPAEPSQRMCRCGNRDTEDELDSEDEPKGLEQRIAALETAVSALIAVVAPR